MPARSTLLPGLPEALIWSAYAAAPGNEVDSGKFDNPESSAALVANVFGLFLDRPADLPPIAASLPDCVWLPQSVRLEAVARFPWSGGRHPCLDVLVRTPTTLVGVESKRYEPFRSKTIPVLSDAYWRPVWGERMGGYERIRNGLRDGSVTFRHLDAAQLVKHAFGLRTAAMREATKPILIYLNAEPQAWPDGRTVPQEQIDAHQREIATFAATVAGDEVAFLATTYREMLGLWYSSPSPDVRHHVEAVRERFRFVP